ncbi:Fic family protein [Candidatus Formimonas warabiya]|uniref:Fido domain-containing protein n=1 Tax=Formimonas warabiya TaxID=1761012 RepID=A0A3G1KV40_FORW1|nr:Fic family protein [Candidatus Formimonas warabiya]ATW26383.1 hypothetical protein DCMF_17895 [Candidatus Formimonas warabiya]
MERVRFIPVPAWQTNEAIDELVNKFSGQKRSGGINELVLIGALILDFLCIHPFSDGNGRWPGSPGHFFKIKIF